MSDLKDKNNIDYKDLKFKCGIEIHQQLETHKLFCKCPSIVRDDNPDIFFERKLRAVVGETGKIDQAASHEQGKQKIMKYEGCSTSSCLVELDEEPPHSMNNDALKIVLQVSELLNAKVVDEIQVMRKTVIDGSNVSGFQRTSLVATDGYIETSQGRVNIPTICLEEEAAQKLKSDDGSLRYRLDRLGVPLIEIATDPDIISPEHAKETAEKLGMILRSTGKVKRGIGTIRQDVNVSIQDKARVEIKGFQDLKSIPVVIENEVKRHHELYEKGEEFDPHVRKANADGTTTFLRPMPGAARMYPETDVLPIRPKLIEFEKVELIDDKINRYTSDYGIGDDLAKMIAKSQKADFFESCVSNHPDIKSAFLAETIISLPRELRRKENVDIDQLPEEKYDEAFTYLDDGKISKDSIPNVLLAMTNGTFNLKDFETISEDDLRKEIEVIVKSMEGKPMGAIMGEVMKKFQGKVDGKKASSIIRELIK